MIFTDIQNHGSNSLQRLGGFQLETGQFHHIDIRDGLLEHIQCRIAQITPSIRRPTGFACHQIHQSGHTAFAIGASNRDYRRFGSTHKQLDITHNVRPTFSRCPNLRGCHRNTGAYDQSLCLRKPIFSLGKSAKRIRNLWETADQFVLSGWIFTAIHHGKGNTLGLQITGNG